MKRRIASPLLMCFALVLLFGSGRARGQSIPELTKKLERLNAYPDLIVVNGRIATMDAQLTQVQAVAIKNSRILARGSSAEIRSLAGPNTEVLDAKGRTVLPGMIDTHTHPQSYTVQHWLGAEGDFTSKKYNDPQLKIVLAKGNDKVEVLRSLERVVRQRAQELGPGKWILVQLFGKNTLPESREITWSLVQRERPTVTTEILDSFAPDNPVVVFGSERIGQSSHNTRAKELMEKFVGHEAFSYTSGGTAIVFDILFRGRTEEKMDFLKRELEELAAQGITTYSTTYYGTPTIIKIVRLLIQRGDMPARWAWWLQAGEHNNVGDFRGIGNDYLWNAGVGNESFDNEIICTTAKPANPINLAGGLGLAGFDGPRPDCEAANFDYEKVRGYTSVRGALEAGLRIGFLHAYSDGSFDALFHMIDQAVAEGKITPEEVRALRITTEHTPIIRPDSIPKIVKYGIRPSFTAYMMAGDMKGGAFLKTYGEQYMNWMMPLKSLVSAGAHPAFGSDSHFGKGIPVEWQDMEFPPQWAGNVWGFYEFFVTRQFPNDGITYDLREGGDRIAVMKAATIWGAETVLNEKNIGSLEVGKLADFIVIDKDYFTIPEDQIHTIRTLLTAVGGKTVYKSSSF